MGYYKRNSRMACWWILVHHATGSWKVPTHCQTDKKCHQKEVYPFAHFPAIGRKTPTCFILWHPGGKGSFKSKEYITITLDLKTTLQDWRTLVQHLSAFPTPAKLLVMDYPNYIIIITDACSLGAGGVITLGTDSIAYWVWKLEWPATIKEKLINDTNPNVTLTINDLELPCMVLRWLALKMLQLPLAFKDVGLFCDNTSAVSSSAHKGSTSTSPYANGNAKSIAHFRHKLQDDWCSFLGIQKW